MYKIEYEIKLNESGRPCIDLPEDYEHRPEDKFFAIELARYILQEVYSRRSAEFDKETANTIDISIRLLGQIGDNIAEILWNQMESMGEVAFLVNNKYHFQLNSIEERDKIGKYIVTSGKIFKRQEGLRVFIVENMKIYELQNGIENENWIEII